jgi:hypothetical protein
LERAARKQRLDVVAKLEAELECPPFPQAAERAWGVWHRLRTRRGPGATGPAPITWTDIDAFLRVTGNRLASPEIGFVEIIDNAYLKSTAAPASVEEAGLALKDGLKRVVLK